jgi:hypothetical protein
MSFEIPWDFIISPSLLSNAIYDIARSDSRKTEVFKNEPDLSFL